MSDFNLGTVTAYGYAKDKGYTGTEDEFAALMASYADVAEQAAESAEQAAASATTATTKASEASDSASAASASKTAAQNAQSSAESAATTATTKASEASNSASTAMTKAGEATTAAGTATTAATSAAGSATTATTKAGEAATSATTAAEAAQRAEDAAATLVIDDTLTHAGQAADAKKTGDEIGDLKDGLDENVNDLKSAVIDAQNNTITVESGTWRNGVLKYNDNSRARTVYDIDISWLYGINVTTDFRMLVYGLDGSGVVQYTGSWTTEFFTTSLTSDVKYLHIIFRKNPDISDMREYVDELRSVVEFVSYKDVQINKIPTIENDIANNKSAIEDAQNNQITLESGKWTDGVAFADISRLRTKYLVKINDLYKITVPSGYYFWPFAYNVNLEALTFSTLWRTELLISDLPTNTEYIRMNFRKNPDESDIRSQIETFKDVLSLVTKDGEQISKIEYLSDICSKAVITLSNEEFNSADFDTMNCGNAIIIF